MNKALLYYYFKDKDTLYGAVLDQAFGGLTNTLLLCPSTCPRARKCWLTPADTLITSPATPVILASCKAR